MKKKTIGKVLTYFLLGLFLILAVFPFFWMISTSLKSTSAIFSIPPQLIPQQFNFDAYKEIWAKGDFLRYFLNSAKVAGLTTLFAMVVSIMAGLGFGRFHFRGSKALQLLLLLAQLFPLVLLVTPYYTIMSKLGITDTHTALFITYISFVVPFSVWMLTNYFKALPVELEEAAMIDGCSKIKALIHITVPLAAPGLAATAINAFILAWNEFLFAQTFIDSVSLRTLPIGLKTFMGQYSTQWNLLMVGAVVSTVPVVILFVFLQKHLVSGMTSGAVKS